MTSQTPSLEHTLRLQLLDRKSRSQFRSLSTFPPNSIDFSSNSYLSLSTNLRVREAYLSYLKQYSSRNPFHPLFGAGGSRLLDGNSCFAEDLEKEIAAYHGAESGLLFNSGFDANVGLFTCVPQSGDVIVYDELIHASVHDGMRASRAAQKLPFRHNAITLNAQSDASSGSASQTQGLSGVLQSLTTQSGKGEGVKRGAKTVFVAVEAVYSMDGDVAPLREIIACLEKHLPNGNGRLIVDEAHSTGLLGPKGCGLVSELGLEGKIFIRLHTFGKATSSSGAIVLCSPLVRAYLINYARSLIYSTAMPLTTLAGIKVAYDFLAHDEAEILRGHLRSLAIYAYELFHRLCHEASVTSTLVRIDQNVSGSPTPIIPLWTHHPRSLARFCQQRGFIVRPIVAPTVPKGSERVRVCLHAANTRAEVEALAWTVKEWALETQNAPKALL